MEEQVQEQVQEQRQRQLPTRALLVGTPPQGTDKLDETLQRYGVKVEWRRRASKSSHKGLPPGCDLVVVNRDFIGHSDNGGIVSIARKAGLQVLMLPSRGSAAGELLEKMGYTSQPEVLLSTSEPKTTSARSFGVSTERDAAYWLSWQTALAKHMTPSTINKISKPSGSAQLLAQIRRIICAHPLTTNLGLAYKVQIPSWMTATDLSTYRRWAGMSVGVLYPRWSKAWVYLGTYHTACGELGVEPVDPSKWEGLEEGEEIRLVDSFDSLVNAIRVQPEDCPEPEPLSAPAQRSPEPAPVLVQPKPVALDDILPPWSVFPPRRAVPKPPAPVVLELNPRGGTDKGPVGKEPARQGGSSSGPKRGPHEINRLRVVPEPPPAPPAVIPAPAPAPAPAPIVKKLPEWMDGDVQTAMTMLFTEMQRVGLVSLSVRNEDGDMKLSYKYRKVVVIEESGDLDGLE